MDKKLKANKAVMKALAALDTAVQKWYAVNNPDDTEHYATMHIRNYPNDPDGDHVSEITLVSKHNYTYLRSSKDNRR